MPRDPFRIEIENLAEFRRAVRRADLDADRALRLALRDAAEDFRSDGSTALPKRSGALAASGKTFAQQTKVGVRWTAQYAGGAEWGRRGKWAGWSARYGAPPRFTVRVLERNRDRYGERVLDALSDTLSAQGWLN